MKKQLLVALLAMPVCLYAQKKLDYERYNNVVPIDGTEYLYATAEHEGKKSTDNDFLMFINTQTGETKKVEFPKGSQIYKINHIRYDSIGVNKIMLIGKTVDLNDRGGINYNDPTQVIILSVDGKEKNVITSDGYFVNQWYLSAKYGTLTILGYYDSNNNGRNDYNDKAEILVYDLKQMKLLSRT
ncbi:hypothetical protein CAP35_13240 [Chitinophagaceae bacterium IBVUCB1]|nr:hypothetical protein CAP35_13240 [Chitinophagaceae bacterium IBVUCB1]